LASGTPEAAVRLSSSSSSVLVRLPSYKTVVYSIYLSTIKSAKEKRRGPKKKHKRIHSSLLSTKTSCRTKTKRGTTLYQKDLQKSTQSDKPELIITYTNGSQIIFFLSHSSPPPLPTPTDRRRKPTDSATTRAKIEHP